jgi:hypothetical protein
MACWVDSFLMSRRTVGVQRVVTFCRTANHVFAARCSRHRDLFSSPRFRADVCCTPPKTINRFRQDYGDMFAGFPAPTQAMADAHHAHRDQSEDGLLIDRWLVPKVDSHMRLDPLAAKAGFDEWKKRWAKHATSANCTFDGIPAELKKYVDQDLVCGIMQARDMTQR